MPDSALSQRAAAVRQFNRFYTRQIGLLAGHYLDSPFSLTEARVVYELAQHEAATAAGLVRELGLDPGYLSRILRGFQRRGLLRRQPSPADGRQSLLRLTPKGRRAFQALNDRSQHDLEAMLGALPLLEQSQLVDAMGAIERLLGAPAAPAAAPAALPATKLVMARQAPTTRLQAIEPAVAMPPAAEPGVAQPPVADPAVAKSRVAKPPVAGPALAKLRLATPERYVLRGPRPGDLGWVVARHGAVYAQEYGWDESFEALVAEIVAGFVQHYDAQRERCWIAETGGVNVGSVFVVKKTRSVAKLRLLLVEPAARGQGLGARLVDECVSFARQAGYRQLTLWTNSVLVAARHLYAKAGFRLVDSGPHHAFGQDLVEETWLLEL